MAGGPGRQEGTGRGGSKDRGAPQAWGEVTFHHAPPQRAVSQAPLWSSAQPRGVWKQPGLKGLENSLHRTWEPSKQRTRG